MPNMLDSGHLVASIQADLADNNAGLISAFDVRHNMEDIAYSINHIVASGDTKTEFPFFNTVRVTSGDRLSAASASETNGDIVIESGIFFDNPYTQANNLHDKRQVQPWLGEEGIDHGSIAGLGDDDHVVYYNLNGVRALTGNMKTNGVWINASGQTDAGIKFVVDSPTDKTHQTILVSGYQARSDAGFSTSGGFKFKDNSIVPNGKGMAKAWLSLNTSGTHDGVDDRPVLKSYHNISGVQRDGEGKLTITFTSGTFENNDYVAIGTANGRNTGSGPTNFEVNTVGTTQRQGDDGTSLRTCSVYILDDDGSFQDSTHLDLVFFGYSPTETSGTHPTISRA